jgi:hypothetical protein
VIPLIAGIGIGTILWSSRAIFYGGTAGMSYAIGKKVGRKACVALDGLEDRARALITDNVVRITE